MIYNVYHDRAREQAYAEAKARLEACYDDGKTHLEALCELNRIHLSNLSYLEQVAARYGLDAPLKLVNELQSERQQLSQVQAEIGLLEKKLEQPDISDEMDRQEYEAAEAQRQSKLAQAEMYRKNIAYLEELAEKHTNAAPLSLHNALREEAQRLLFVRQCITKLDQQMQALASALDQADHSERIGYRRADHRALIAQAHTAPAFHANTLKLIGSCALEQPIFCVITWGSQICVLAPQASGVQAGLIDLLYAYVEELSGEEPQCLELPCNPEKFYERFGQAVLARDIQYAKRTNAYEYMSMTPSFQADMRSLPDAEERVRVRFDFEFHPETDVTYLNADPGIVEGGRWLWWWKMQEARRRRKQR